jgi:hypothetical protein
MKEGAAEQLLTLGLGVGAVGVALVAVALWASWGWPAALGFVGTLAMVTGVAILRVRG